MKTKESLAGVRVLDLTDEKGQYCGKLLADLGADVIKVEPPGGDATRRIGPFFQDKYAVEKSLYWFHFNTSKRSVTLNLDHPEGTKIMSGLASTADVVLETFPPGYLDDRALGYSSLRKATPRLILTSITGFGQTGPWKNYKASDIVAMAVGGLLYECGWTDLPPMQMACSLAYHQVSVEAATATLIALFHRQRTGMGQHVDVSMQQSIPVSLQPATFIYEKTGVVRKRMGGGPRSRSQSESESKHGQTSQRELPAQGIFACKNGYVDIGQLSGIAWWDRFVAWLDSQGGAADLKDEKWRDPFLRTKPEVTKHINDVLGDFLKTRTKEEIFHSGQKGGVVVGPVNTPEDIVNDPQLRFGKFFVPVEHPELQTTLHYIGAPYKLSETPWRISRRAPLIGEHNSEIYQKELGLSGDGLARLKAAGVI